MKKQETKMFKKTLRPWERPWERLFGLKYSSQSVTLFEYRDCFIWQNGIVKIYAIKHFSDILIFNLTTQKLCSRWGSNSQPRHFSHVLLFKYCALTDCATGAHVQTIQYICKRKTIIDNILITWCYIALKYDPIYLTISSWKNESI